MPDYTTPLFWNMNTRSTNPSALTVVIDSNVQLGAVSSPEHFKTDIAAMGSSTERLERLRPVTFHYRSAARGAMRYGLVAGEVTTVLLNEGQKGQATVAMLVAEHHADAARIATLERQWADIRAALVKMQPADDLIVRR